jgi:hypothetical protein
LIDRIVGLGYWFVGVFFHSLSEQDFRDSFD